MKRAISVWLIFLISTIFFLVQSTASVEDEVKTSLINFVTKLDNNGDKPGFLSGWNLSSDPCEASWNGVICGAKNSSVKKLFLNSSNLAGELDVGLLCEADSLAASLAVIHLENNGLTGELSSSISSCKQLTHLHLSSNRLSGTIPSSLTGLNNLKTLDISGNEFSGTFPDLSRISGLAVFLAQNNEITGEFPRLEFSNLRQFNVSNNLLSGRVPDSVHGRFRANSFLGNPSLCGDPTPNQCPNSQISQPEIIGGDSKDDHSSNKNQLIMFGGYVVLGIVVVLILVFLVYKRYCNKDELPNQAEPAKNEGSDQYYSSLYNSTSREENNYFSGVERSALVLLQEKGLQFEDLLKAPAEMLGRGTDGSAYKVTLETHKILVVKRIKNWAISSFEFRQRMERLDQVKHPNVLPALAFYSSKQEKLLVYDFQQNGSLFKFLHATNNRAQQLDWISRLNVASSIGEALAFMHNNIYVPHGNLKSSNILFNNNMEACLSEYGLSTATNTSSLNDDVYRFGTILLELLTGNLANHNGVDLTDWVNAAVREEWTAEVFDTTLLSEYASEERMVNLLQVALKCVNRSPQARPSMRQVVAMIHVIKVEEERSTSMAFSGP